MITIIARLKARPGKEKILADGCVQFVKVVREKEKGCTMYEPYVNPENPAEIIVLEKYIDQEALDNHFQTEHFQALAANFDELLDGPPILEKLTALA